MLGESGCVHCERVIQPFLDRELTASERVQAERHLDECGSCRKAYRFEVSLRRYVRRCCSQEPMPSSLKERLAALSRETRV